MDLEIKRKILLENLEKAYQNFECQKFEEFSGPGIKKKIMRLLFSPHIYIPFILFKFNLFPKTKSQQLKLLGYKEITIDMNDFNSFILSKFGILYGLSEYKLTKFFIKNLKKDDVFYDIGANYGFYTYLALEFCQEVHSFEPLPDAFEILKNNLRNSVKVYLNNLALSNRNSTAKLTVAGGGSTIIREIAKSFEKEKDEIEVQTITLDNYIKTHKPPTIIKMDVEGAESLIIEGGKECLKNNNPVIAMEVWSGERGMNFSMKAVEKLYQLGYKSYKINKNGDVESHSIMPGEEDNFIFMVE